MIKNVLQIFFVLMISAFAAYAQAATEGEEPQVIDTLSDTYQKNFTIQSPPSNVTSSTSNKAKYISGFTEDSTNSSFNQTQNNSVTESQKEKQELTPQEQMDNVKILKSN